MQNPQQDSSSDLLSDNSNNKAFGKGFMLEFLPESGKI